jgi:flagellar assembly protein FliH
MRPAKRYLFDRSFETDLSSQQAATAFAQTKAVAPIYTSEDLERARADGMALGRADALAECNNEREIGRLRQATLDAIAGRLGELLASSTQASGRAAKDAVAIAAALARKLLPRLYRERACSELEELITSVLARIGDEPKVIVSIAPALLGELAPVIEASAAARGLEKRLTVVGDSTLEEGDCRIDWSGGGIIRDHTLLWREIDELLAECIVQDAPRPLSLPSPAVSSGENHV